MKYNQLFSLHNKRIRRDRQFFFRHITSHDPRVAVMDPGRDIASSQGKKAANLNPGPV